MTASWIQGGVRFGTSSGCGTFSIGATSQFGCRDSQQRNLGTTFRQGRKNSFCLQLAELMRELLYWRLFTSELFFTPPNR